MADYIGKILITGSTGPEDFTYSIDQGFTGSTGFSGFTDYSTNDGLNIIAPWDGSESPLFSTGNIGSQIAILNPDPLMMEQCMELCITNMSGMTASVIVDGDVVDIINGDSLIINSTSVEGKPADPYNFITFESGEWTCVHPLTKISTPNKLVNIKDIKAGDTILDINGNEVEVLYNIQGLRTDDFIVIKKDAFGTNKPLNDFYIREGHPLFIDNQEIDCQDLINNDTVRRVKLDDFVPIYSLCTENRIFVMMEGVPVCTWAKEEWEEYSKDIGIKWWKQ